MNLPPHNPNLVVSTDGYWDADASNGLRARSAQNAIRHYSRERGFDTDEVTCTIDLIADTLHYLHSLGEDPFVAIEKARGFFEKEANGTSMQIAS